MSAQCASSDSRPWHFVLTGSPSLSSTRLPPSAPFWITVLHIFLSTVMSVFYVLYLKSEGGNGFENLLEMGLTIWSDPKMGLPSAID